MTTHTVEVSRDIAAPPGVVFAAITDVTRMGEWSPETRGCEWNDGATAAAVGARFTGHNRNGDMEWSIEATDGGCRVTESWVDRRPQKFIDAGEGISGVADRATHNKAGMEATLAALATALE